MNVLTSFKTKISQLLESSLIKKGIMFTLFATLNNGLNFLLIFILSIYLSKEDFGVLNLFNVLIIIVSVLISLGTQSYFGVIFFKKTHDYLIRILNSILIISTVVLSFFVIIVLFFPTIISGFLGFSTQYQIYALILCYLQLFYTINLEVYRLEEKPIQYGVLSLIWISINFILTVVFCISLKNGWTGRVDAQVISAIVLFVINIIILYRKDFIKLKLPNKTHYLKTLKFGLPLVPHNSTVWIRQGFDRYIINFFHGAALVGSYSFAYNLSGIILMIGTAFNSTNSVYIFKKLTNEKVESINKSLSKQIYLMTILFAVITVVGYIISYFVIVLFLHKYLDAIQYLIPLFIAAFFQCIYYLFVNYLLFFDKTKTLMYITFSISIFHFILSFLLTRYSVLFTTYLSLISNFLICCFVIYYANNTFLLFNFKKVKLRIK